MGMEEAVLSKLERRLGRLHATLRLGIETDHEAQIFGQGINVFHIEGLQGIEWVILRDHSGRTSVRAAAACR